MNPDTEYSIHHPPAQAQGAAARALSQREGMAEVAASVLHNVMILPAAAGTRQNNPRHLAPEETGLPVLELESLT